MLAPSKRTHLNRALSKLGLCSRGVAERWIAEGRVTVNGVAAASPEQWVELGSDRIEVAGEVTPAVPAPRGASPSTGPSPEPARERAYLVLNKPAGYVTTRSDELGRKTVYDLLPEAFAAGWVFPVGRLDRDSEGLLLLTNDGEWANLLTDPGFHVEKTYRVKLDRKPLEAELERFRIGIMLDGRRTLPARATAEGGVWVRVGITEGRNRQIRRMFRALGYTVKRLVRIAVGSLELGDLAEGAVTALGPEWIGRLEAEARRQKARPPL